MESTTSQDPVALAVQVQSLAAMVEELTKQNQKMRQQLQQEKNRTNVNGDDSNGRRTSTPEEMNSNLLKEMRKEMDELRNAIREKTDRSLDRIVRNTDSPFTVVVQECPVPSKFHLPQLEPFDGLKDPLDHLNIFKTTLGVQQPPNEILCRSFPTTFKGAAWEWFNKLPASSIDNFEQLSGSFVRHFVGGQCPKRTADHLITIKRRERNLEILCNELHLRDAGSR